jgi:hypothetical protein
VEKGSSDWSLKLRFLTQPSTGSGCTGILMTVNRQFGWNNTIDANQTKTLHWNQGNLDFEHVGGGAFVLTSMLFEDGSGWDELADSSSCKIVWRKGHTRVFTRPIELPAR